MYQRLIKEALPTEQENQKYIIQFNLWLVNPEVHPERCLIRFYKLYVSKCPVDHLNEAIHLKPLAKPTNACWYQKTPVGLCMLQKTVRRLCESAGFDGHFTNYSLCATTVTKVD